MDLKFNISDGYYQNINLAHVRTFFSRILHQRVIAYQNRYQENLFPFGIEDFVCQHVSVEVAHTEQILGSFKYINLKTCRQFDIPFPLMSTLQKRNCTGPLYQVEKKMSELEEQQKNIAYIGALNVAPQLKQNPERRKQVKNMLAAGIVHCANRDRADSILVTGSIPNGSHLFINWLGFQQFSDEPVVVSSIGRTTAYIMEWENWSKAALENAKKYSSEWEEALATTEDLRAEENAKVSRVA